MNDNPVKDAINADLVAAASGGGGVISGMAAKYGPQNDRLLGFLLTLSYEEMRIVTCDPWKRKCGGVPRNSFVIVKVNPGAAGPANVALANRLILARVTESVPTPVESEIQSTIFQVHKVQAILDPFTNKELQWGALKATILGTYYDVDGGIGFGNDVDAFLAAHCYEVYVPSDQELSLLINSFVPKEGSIQIGSLRYTETPSAGPALAVPVLVDPLDFIGRGSGNRTALFGKTRMGKSNAIKIIADTIFRSSAAVSQLIFDPSGEYTYVNEQDKTSLFAIHHKRSVRYSLSPRLPDNEKALGLTSPQALRINFYTQPQVGHALISALFGSQFPNRPNYISDVLEWEPPEPSNIPSKAVDPSAHNRGWREIGIWWATLDAASYSRPSDQGTFLNVVVPLKQEIKREIAAMGDRPAAVKLATGKNPPEIASKQPLSVVRWIYVKVAGIFAADPARFPDGNGPYFSKGAQALLRILAGVGISGTTYLRPFAAYHDLGGSDVFSDIVGHLEAGH